MAARSISCSAWPAATRTFFGVQPRFGQVPPRSCDSIIATDIPARLTGPVTPMPALPPPRITTSNVSLVIGRPHAHPNRLRLIGFDITPDHVVHDCVRGSARTLATPGPAALDFKNKRPA